MAKATPALAGRAVGPLRLPPCIALPASPTGAFSAKALEAAIKQTVRGFCVESECVTRRSRGLSTAGTCPHSEMEFRDRSCARTYAPG
jgi:hypothetical protein